MIIIEERFNDLITQIPDIKHPSKELYYSVKFGYGDPIELNRYIKQNKGDSYPLVWLLYPYIEKHLKKGGSKEKVQIDNINLIIACGSNGSLTNPERFDFSYKKILIPVYDYLLYIFERSNIIDKMDGFEVTKFPNYGIKYFPADKEESFAGDIWDAIKFRFDCIVNNNCLRQIII